ncbi:MAG: hypothetical protein HY674_03450 [Chloroflexi bacterium]|nr:hypothetical protein [Chloroflexota bacterium]
METVTERVETLEMTLARFIASTNTIIQRLDRTCERLDRSYEQVRQEMERRDRDLEQRERQIEQRDKQVERLDRTYEQVRQEMEQRERQIEQRDKEIAQRDKQIEQRDKQHDRDMEQRDKQMEQRDKQHDRDMEQRDKQMEQRDLGLEEIKRDAREHTLEMARIADRIGRFAEDIVGPNVPRLAREVFGITEFALFAQRIKKRHATDPSRLREFDFAIAGNRQLVITETKATARLKDVGDFAHGLKEVFDYFPEYHGYVLVPIFASMAVGSDLLKRLTRLKIYALVLGERTMELLNLEEVRAKRH